MSVEYFDEFAGGVPYVASYAVQGSLGVPMATLALAVFVLPQAFSLLVEAPLLVWAEQRSRRQTLLLGVCGMALAQVSCALAPHIVPLAIAWTLFFLASGVACGIAQAALMDADPERRERRMMEWALAGCLGDLTTPFLLWAAQACGYGWRLGFAVTGALLGLQALVLLRCTEPDSLARSCKPLNASDLRPQDDEDSLRGPRLRATLGTVFSNRPLLFWLGGIGLCGFMDEMLAVLVAQHVHLRTGYAGALARELAAFTVGGVLGLAGFHRLAGRVSGTRLLLLSAAGCAVSYGLWLALETSWLSALALFFTGASAAVHYPVAQAQAYRALPERATLVAAATQLLGIFEMALPLALGLLVDRLGLGAALLVLVAQPLGLLVMALLADGLGRSSMR